MVGAIALLLAYQLAGELLVLLLGLPVPGPVIGMLLLFLTLLVRDGAEQPLRDVAQGRPSNLSSSLRSRGSRRHGARGSNLGGVAADPGRAHVGHGSHDGRNGPRHAGSDARRFR